MQLELKRLQRELGTTFVMVTHDQTEALSISDRIVVMNQGRIEQAATPAELYDRPATRFVAGFIGAMNLVPGRVVGRDAGGVVVEAAGMTLPLPPDAGPAPATGAATLVGIRPEDLAVAPSSAPGMTRAVVEGTVFHGRSLRVHLRPAGADPVMADVPRAAGAHLKAGDPVFVGLRPGATCPLLPAHA